MTTKLLLAGALIALLILPAGAQQAPQGTPTRIRGYSIKRQLWGIGGRIVPARPLAKQSVSGLF
jgi:hypothetical protein